ncbi:MAG: hypothetical protein EXR98_12180 [Gemmataceae bacterium]|nr:hypothetical protein [Gemmataceae bacterium]
MPPRILVLSASVGTGHLRAAEAVELALRQTLPDATVKNLDVLEMTNRLFKRLYGQFYLDLVNKAPHALGYFYDMLDQPRSPNARSDKFRLYLEKLNLKSFVKFLKAEPWDLVINTHFLPAEIIASLRTKNEIALPQVTVTTDFETHRLWVNQPCDRFFTATPEGALYLQHWGIPASDTFVTGIPIHPVFSAPKDRGGVHCQARPRGGSPDRLAALGRVRRRADRKDLSRHPQRRTADPARHHYRAQREVEGPAQQDQAAAEAQGQGDGLHEGDRRDDAGRRSGGDEAGRLDHVGGAGARRGDGDRQPDPGPGEPQQRLSPGERRRHQGEQHRDAELQAERVPARPGPHGSVARQRPQDRQAARGV